MKWLCVKWHAVYRPRQHKGTMYKCWSLNTIGIGGRKLTTYKAKPQTTLGKLCTCWVINHTYGAMQKAALFFLAEKSCSSLCCWLALWVVLLCSLSQEYRSSLGSRNFLHTSFTKVGKLSVVSGREAVLRRFVPEGLGLRVRDSIVTWLAGCFRLGSFSPWRLLGRTSWHLCHPFWHCFNVEWASRDSSWISNPAYCQHMLMHMCCSY